MSSCASEPCRAVCELVSVLARAPFRRPLMALIIAEVSSLVMAYYEDTIARQMLSLPTPGLLVYCSFIT